jgi:pilus assembly protein Flp/PilA
MHNLKRFLNDEAGATAIEYGLIAALVAVVIITGITAVGTKLSTTLTNVSTSLRYCPNSEIRSPSISG